MNFEAVPVTPFQQNCSVVWCAETSAGAIVDPGGDAQRIFDAVTRINCNVVSVLITHGHLDHASATAAVAAQYGVPIIGPHPDDQFLISQLADQGERYGIHGAATFVPDRWLADGDVVEVGNLQFDVVHCPGHTPGHVVFVERSQRFALVGDVLFKGSVGRTDLPRGNFDTLAHAIRKKLFPLGDDITFLPGHGDTSTFGWERMCNPFVCDIAFGEG